MKYILAVLLIMLSLSVSSADVYSVKPDISEKELRGLYVDMLTKYVRYAESKWHQSAPDSNVGYWGNGLSDGNEGIRAVANTAMVYAILIRDTKALDSATSRKYQDKAIAGIRYVAESHLTGSGKSVDGKQWGNSWQSTMWAANMGFAAWILWDDLDAGLRTSVERVVVYEADRFLGRKPGSNRWGDTKAEENGWDQILISLAPNMFPQQPNAAKWREKSMEFMMNTLSAPQDAKDSTVVDGRPVNDWVTTANTHPDFTLENHGFFHPTYTMVSAAEIGQGALFYAYAGNPIPQAAGHHLMDNWRALQGVVLPTGEWSFPQGMDWELHSESHIHYMAWLATYAHDPLAAMMERSLAQRTRDQQKLYGGGFAGPGSRMGFGRDAIAAERAAYAYLYHKFIGPAADDPVTAERTFRSLRGVRRYLLSDFIVHRTDSKLVSFSWKNQIMGMVIAIGPGHDGNPHVATPITNGLVGSFAVSDPAAKGIKVAERSWRQLENGFETHGTLLVNGGALRQELKLVSIGEKTVIYLDRVTAVKDVRITQESGVPLGIENDELNGNARTLYYEGGSQTVTGPETDRTISIAGKWANIDGRLGIVMAFGSGLAYRDVPNYNRNGAREDYLYGSYSTAPRDYKAGEPVVCRAVVLFTETSPKETAALAQGVRFENRAGIMTVHVSLPEGDYSFTL